MDAEKILTFWFEELDPPSWFKKDRRLDEEIRRRFGAIHAQAKVCALWPWRQSTCGRLAEILVLDQFSRNLFRDDGRAFAQDPLALALAQEAVAQGLDQTLTVEQRNFLYMPYMHSESAAIHLQAVKLFAVPGLENSLDFEFKHKAIIDRFGRYPHRNALLGRESTPEELQFLQQAGSSF